ncbi:MAG: M15 family metallopeptidase [Leptospiraceae bacterium]|nr:M15 family metallopeptidase [Leptospiraceae bacterium]
MALSIQALKNHPDFIDLTDDEHMHFDLRYATENNFMGENLYKNFTRCYLHREAAAKLRQAAAELQQSRPGWKLLIFDCLRPRSVQRKLFEFVRGTPQQPYVADPDQGSIHNYGFAVDLSLLDANSNELDMGTHFDSFDALSEPRLEREHIRTGRLTTAQHANRLILRKIMTAAGFIQLPNEWWHYDALPGHKVRAHYEIVE